MLGLSSHEGTANRYASGEGVRGLRLPQNMCSAPCHDLPMIALMRLSSLDMDSRTRGELNGSNGDLASRILAVLLFLPPNFLT